MIYSFENKFIVEQFRSYIPELRKIVYSEDSSLFLVSDRQIMYPSLYFNRESEDWTMSKAIPTLCTDANGNAVTTKFFQVPINYEGIVLAEKQVDALELMTKLRFAWEKNPYCKMWYPDESNPFTVELRLKYIRIETERNSGSEIGSQRLIKFAWQSLTIPSGVTSISGYTINACYSLQSVVIPSSMTSIGDYIFGNCKSLQSVAIPSSMTSIGSGAFFNCYSLQEMIFERTSPPTLGGASNSLGSTSYTFPIYVPDSAVNSYKSAYTNYASRIKGISERLQ